MKRQRKITGITTKDPQLFVQTGTDEKGKKFKREFPIDRLEAEMPGATPYLIWKLTNDLQAATRRIVKLEKANAKPAKE